MRCAVSNWFIDFNPVLLWQILDYLISSLEIKIMAWEVLIKQSNAQ